MTGIRSALRSGLAGRSGSQVGPMTTDHGAAGFCTNHSLPTARPTTVASAVEVGARAVNDHRWRSMGVGSVQCECGAILHGDDSFTQFPADATFRAHLAAAVLSAIGYADLVNEVENLRITVREDKRVTVHDAT